MQIINAKYEIMRPRVMDAASRDAIYGIIEEAARTCYKSEAKITDGSAAAIVKSLIRRGHEAMLEHASMTVRFFVDRGVSHELVRHRIASFAQESTRYCNYAREDFGSSITFIKPVFFREGGAVLPGMEKRLRTGRSLLLRTDGDWRDARTRPDCASVQHQDGGCDDDEHARMAAFLPPARHWYDRDTPPADA